ncbi:hypothetical protein C2845_PM02G20500 [Panicum miliaceum]|uniref:Uncharacterized protein n=1 Tax=Panicum miliaceum TaxID=4540 RepID=A0A3L6S3N6_PANMI|nr:hypothetical protein C2845_PM02G20500 [Panicum miliaceum]
MASDSSAPSSPIVADYGNVAPPPSESWAPSTLTEEDLQEMEMRGLLPERAISGWKCCYDQEFLSEDRTKTKCNVSRAEAASRVARIMSGEVRDKGCPKAYCLKPPTTEVWVLEFWSLHRCRRGSWGRRLTLRRAFKAGGVTRRWRWWRRRTGCWGRFRDQEAAPPRCAR